MHHTGCPRPATRSKSDPSPVYGWRGTFHCTDLPLSHGGNHLQGTTHIHWIKSSQLNVMAEEPKRINRRKHTAQEWREQCFIELCGSLSGSLVSVYTKERRILLDFTFAVIMGVFLFFIIRAQNLFWLLRFLRRCLLLRLLSSSWIYRLPDEQRHQLLMKPLDQWVWGQRPMVHHEQTCDGKFAEGVVTI